MKTQSTGGVTWTLTLGTNSERQIETRAVSFSGGTVPTDRTEVDTITYANNPNVPAYQCQESYHCYSWGWELAQTSVANGTAPLVTAYSYCTDANDPDNSYGQGYGQVKTIQYPDGYWEKHIYTIYDPQTYLPAYETDVLNPYLDSRGQPAITLADATVSNTHYTQFLEFPFEGQSFNEYYSGAWTKAMENNYFDDISWTSEGTTRLYENGIAQYDGNGPIDNNGPDRYFWKYTEDAPLGLSGHDQLSFNWDKQGEFDYYDHGIYNAATGAFVIDPEHHLYTNDLLSIKYPDHRETRVFFDDRFVSFFWIGNHGTHPWGDDPLADGSERYYDMLEGHRYGWPLGSGYASKNVRIFQGGSLVQTEQYECTDVSSDTPGWTLLYKYKYLLDNLGRATNVVRIDGANATTRTVYTADYRGTGACDGPLLISETDETGQQTCYTYDSLQRMLSATVKGHGIADRVTTNAYDANFHVVSTSTKAGALSRNESWSFDQAGRVTYHVDPSGIATQIVYSADNQTITSTTAGGIYTVKTQGIDRLPSSLTGNGCVPEFYQHFATYLGTGDWGNPFSFQLTGLGDMTPGFRFVQTCRGAANSPRWTMAGLDAYNHSDCFQGWPLGSGTANCGWIFRSYVESALLLETHLSGVMLTDNNTPLSWMPLTQAVHYLDPNGNEFCVNTNDLTTGRPARDVRLSEGVILVGNVAYHASTNFLDDNAPIVRGIHLEQLNNLATNVLSCSIDYDADGNVTTNLTTVDRANNIITVTTSKPNTSTLPAVTLYQNGQIVSASTLSVATPTLYSYDDLGRTNLIQDPQGNFVFMKYDANTGWLTNFTDQAGHPTCYQYYGITETNSGKLKCQTGANGKKTYYAYTPQGQLYRTWGEVPYPAEYRYSEYGDLTNLITFRGGTGWTGASWPQYLDYSTGDNTYWFYDAASGALTNKMDAKGQSVSYAYDPNTGRLQSRSWGRTTLVTNADNKVSAQCITVTNSYNGFGDLTAQEYNDGTPNVYFNNYNRDGQPCEIIDGSGTNELVYDNASRLSSSTCVCGLLQGITVANHFDWRYGRDKLTVSLAGGWNLEDDYGYDVYGRLGSVACGTNIATYGYVPNSDLLQSTKFTSGSTLVMTTTRKWNYGFQLASIANVVDGASTPVTSHAYTYDNVNRRTEAKLEDGSAWEYGYNDRNELTGANRYWYDSRPVSGQQFGYNYDNIGNRTWARFGGDTNGNNLQTISYNANNLNQYTNIVTPGMQDIIGAALGTNSVTVNAGSADRHGEYFHRQISVANTNQPVCQTVSVSSGGATSSGGLVFPANNQTLVYDADGNLTFDGVWNYQWDGENRLISMNMTNITSLSTNLQGLVTNRLRLDFVYDYLGRRVQKTVSVWNSTTSFFQNSSTNHFVYDGCNLVVILNAQSSISESFVWGLDMQRTMTKAGGVGGLLVVHICGTNCFPTYDGNGNITGLVTAADRILAARYEYDPYGRLLRTTGLLARQNPFRFSSKYFDEESLLTYFGNRYYDQLNGRWFNRDLSGEQGSINVYGFVGNNPIYAYDANGLDYYVGLCPGGSCSSHLWCAVDLPDGKVLRFDYCMKDYHDGLADKLQAVFWYSKAFGQVMQFDNIDAAAKNNDGGENPYVKFSSTSDNDAAIKGRMYAWEGGKAPRYEAIWANCCTRAFSVLGNSELNFGLETCITPSDYFDWAQKVGVDESAATVAMYLGIEDAENN